MNRFCKIIIVGLVSLIVSGCFTPIAIKGIREEHKARGGQEMSILQAIKAEPLEVGGCILLDGLLIYGGYEGLRYLNDQNSNSGSVNSTSGRDTIDINVNGDGNDIHIGDENTDTFDTSEGE